VGKAFPGTVWRSWSETSSFGSLITTENPITWSDENAQVSIKLYAQNMLIGFLVLRFATPVERTQDTNSEIAELSLSLSLYLALRFHESLGLDDEVPTSHPALLISKVDRMITLTTRQVSILSGIAAKKTNHEIAKELGYSVSTIRHETMRIFEAFGVSDRVAAAVEGKRLGLL
jgi:ATP/maltotriose-dependent transcriptional regulator MalT